MTIRTVRTATPSDMEAVLALYSELRPLDPLIPTANLPDLWAAVTQEGRSAIWVAVVNQDVAATCMLAQIANLACEGRPIGIIEHVITAAKFRRQGLGRLLLQHVLNEAWKSNCCKVMLLSGQQRTEAHHVYERVGFKGDIEKGFVAKPLTAPG